LLITSVVSVIESSVLKLADSSSGSQQVQLSAFQTSMSTLQDFWMYHDPKNYRKVAPPDKAVKIMKFNDIASTNPKDVARRFDLPSGFTAWRGLRCIVWHAVRHGMTNDKERMTRKDKGLLKVLNDDSDSAVIVIKEASFGQNSDGWAWFRADILVNNVDTFVVGYEFNDIKVTAKDLEGLLYVD